MTPGIGEAGTTGTDQGAGQSEKPISKLGRQMESIFWAVLCPQNNKLDVLSVKFHYFGWILGNLC